MWEEITGRAWTEVVSESETHGVREGQAHREAEEAGIVEDAWTPQGLESCRVKAHHGSLSNALTDEGTRRNGTSQGWYEYQDLRGRLKGKHCTVIPLNQRVAAARAQVPPYVFLSYAPHGPLTLSNAPLRSSFSGGGGCHLIIQLTYSAAPALAVG